MRQRLVKLAVVALVVGCCAALAGYLWLTRKTVVTLDTSKKYQTITGWEVTARAWETNKEEDRFDASWEAYAPELLSRMVNELGINQVRLEIASGAENPVSYWSKFRRGEIGYLEIKKHYYEKINDNSDPLIANPEGFQFAALDYKVEKMVLPMKRLVEANGEKLRINFCYVDFKWTEAKGTLEHALHPDEYAELIATAFEHLRQKFELVPDSLEIILEPDNTVGWRGAQIGAGMVAAVDRLAKLGFHPQVIAPSTASPHEATRYFDDMLTVPGVSKSLWMYSYHRYSPIPATLAIPGILKRAKQHHVLTGMLEHTDGTVDELYEDLTGFNASGWQMYGIAVPYPPEPSAMEGGGYYYFVNRSAAPRSRVVLSKRSQLFAPYFRHVRAGARRLGAESNNARKDPAFFRNLDGKHVLVIKSRFEGAIEVRGLPAGEYAMSTSTSLGGRLMLPDVTVPPGGPVLIGAPARSVLALWQRN